ncbi:MAG: hypothetical protein GF375_03660 [Candidatus Omnitrophica bacterium]|nr:hypothetical protein [Candidatus Omnitrophota bacterium]MBD3269157.1 hypothetical protein [Candidatus Omnitrophota bacterium]
MNLLIREKRKAERISFSFPVQILHDIRGETVNFSRSGLRLALEKPLTSARTVPVRIDFPFSSPLNSHAEIVWTDKDFYNNRHLCGLRFLRLSRNETRILKEAINNYRTLDSKFVILTDKLRSWLIDLRAKFDSFDFLHTNEEERIEFVRKNYSYAATVLTEHFRNVGEIAGTFDNEKYCLHQNYYRNMLRFLLLDLIEINRFIYRKPLGYAGDFLIMNYFYDFYDKYIGGSSYEKLINSYTCSIPVAYSVVERKNFFKQKILEILQRDSAGRILSIASGSARELIELLREGKITRPLCFDCFDFENETFRYIQNKLEEIPPEKKKNLRIRFIKENFFEFMKGKPSQGLFSNYEFIYSCGLCDYLNEKMVRSLIRYFFPFLSLGGELILTNVKKDDDYRAYYEMLGGWKLTHRSEEEIRAWTKVVEEPHRTELIGLESKIPFMFLILSLRKRFL